MVKYAFEMIEESGPALDGHRINEDVGIADHLRKSKDIQGTRPELSKAFWGPAAEAKSSLEKLIKLTIET